MQVGIIFDPVRASSAPFTYVEDGRTITTYLILRDEPRKDLKEGIRGRIIPILAKRAHDLLEMPCHVGIVLLDFGKYSARRRYESVHRS